AFRGGIQPRAIRDDHVDSRQAFTAPVGRLYESDARVLERHLEPPARILANRHARNLAPSLGQSRRIGRLQLHRGVCTDDLRTFRLAPPAPARRRPITFRLALRIPVDLEESASRVR